MKKSITKGTPDSIDKYVGSRVRGRRVGLGMNQTRLGQAIGVTFQQIQKYENGTNRVSAGNLFKIAKAMGVDVAYFYEGIPESVVKGSVRRGGGLADQPVTAFETDPTRSREAIKLMHNYYRIDEPEVRKRLFQFVKALATSGKAR
jgi:transcriptional regulator with XRE-family HTH domain